MQNLRGVIDDIKSRLPDYLLAKGIMKEIGKDFSCTNPAHQDKHPSCGLVARSDNTVTKCLACGEIMDIFGYAERFDKLPQSGHDFISKTVQTLASTFGIKFDYELDDQTKRKYQKLNTLEMMNSKINTNLEEFPESVKEFINSRKITQETITEFGLGVVKSWNQFKLEVGLTAEDISDHGVDERIFDKDRLIIPIRDRNGNTVAFAARVMDCARGTGPKYINSKNTECYAKGEILYGFDTARKSNRSSIYIVEGYLDVATLAQNGIKNCSAICGTSLTEYHLSEVSKTFSEVIICLDGDKEGLKAAKRSLDLTSHLQTVTTKVMSIPDNHDPDSYIREVGLEKFLELPKLSPIQFKLSMLPADIKIDDIEIERLCNDIANTKSALRRQVMIEDMNSFNPDRFPMQVIRTRVEEILLDNSVEMRQREEELKDIITSSIKKGTSLDSILAYATTSMDRIKTSGKTDIYTEYGSTISIVRASCMERKRGIALDPLKNLDEKLNGIPRHAAMICIPGLPSHGKSSLIRFLAYSVATNDKDIISVYASIDDSLSKTLPSFVAIASNGTLSSKQVSVPGAFPSLDKNILDHYWNELRKLDNLVMFDSTSGPSIYSIERNIKSIANRFPEKKLLIFVDNMLNIASDRVETRERTISVSERLKQLSDTLDAPMIVAVQLNKSSYDKEYAEDKDISETGRIMYDADMIVHIRNELHMAGEKAEYYWADTVNGVVEYKPVILLTVTKNKIPSSTWKGKHWLKFDPDHNQFWDIVDNEIEEYKHDGTVIPSIPILGADVYDFPNAKIKKRSAKAV